MLSPLPASIVRKDGRPAVDRVTLTEAAVVPASIQCATALDQTLVDLVNLMLLANQARWNLTGSGFCPVSRLLGDLAAQAADASGQVAERAATIGHHCDARAEVIARANVLPAVDPGPVADSDAIAVFDAALSIVTTRLRAAIDAVADDLVTGDLLIGITGDLERTAWVIRAHGQ
jgi:starvation-inducible DNA-binding protein